RNRLENLGFFNAEVASDTSTTKRRATVTYSAIPHIIYRINSISFETDSSALGKASSGSENESRLQAGRAYNLDNISSERDRSDRQVKNNGYHLFRADHSLMGVDSTRGNHRVDLHVTGRPFAKPNARHPSTNNSIYIYPHFT